MKGRQPGRATKWVHASVEQGIRVDRTGFRFAVWEKWKRKERMVGTLTVSVGGLRWLPANGKAQRRHDWREVAEWLSQRR
jgi:hypothetical protein